ncbi:Serine/threonine-protein kinase PknB [Roseimaritima ulvae]|uniref:Serine/threonine-protein kinase PknB n=2 Tax=Roseimaritima ulvae TaxID=980254 RepID=A0A5B9QLN4_9BACT|nr:Serine/threonine-protein kinase PknB [Roseimaritima ulvae]
MGQMCGTAAEDLDAHFASCPRCLAAADEMEVNDRLIEDLATTPASLAMVEPHLIQAIAHGLTQRTSADDTAFEGQTLGALVDSSVDKDRAACLAALERPQSKDDLACFGKYRLRAFIGAGGTGLVFAAVDTDLSRVVAVKFLRPSCATVAKHRKRFLRGARAMASVRHEHVLGIHEVGSWKDLPFVVMPHLQGESLQTRLERVDRLTPQAALEMVRQIAMGLAAIDRVSLVHRDIKPDNIWLETPTDRVQIIDFGIASDPESDAEITSPMETMGTPRYMAPEQIVSKHVDHRSDLFSLGSMLYRMLTGRPAFGGSTAFECMVSVTKDSLPPPHLYDRTIPKSLSRIVKRLCEKRPQDRFQSADQLLAALDRIDRTKPPRSFPLWSLAAGAMALLLLTIISLKIKDRDGNETTIRIDSERVAGVEIGLSDATAVLSKPHAEPIANDNPQWNEQEIAAWIRQRGGSVIVYLEQSPSGEIRRVRASEALPPGPFRILGVDSAGQFFDQAYLDRVLQLKYLVSLAINANRNFTDRQLNAIATIKSLKLLHITLQRSDRSPISDDGIQSLTALKKLQTLRMNAPQITNEGIQSVSQLQRLSYFGNEIPLVTDEGLQQLNDLPHLSFLHLLDARQITGQGIAFLKNYPGLQELEITESQLQGDDLRPLSQLRHVHSLTLTNCGIDDAGLAHLAEWKELHSLVLDGTNVSGKGMGQLTCHDSLLQLSLASTPIADESVDTLVQFPNLQRLNVQGSGISSRGIARLRSELPNCRILH